jgi:zinc D-Ala-D-Ala dipeptidase
MENFEYFTPVLSIIFTVKTSLYKMKNDEQFKKRTAQTFQVSKTWKVWLCTLFLMCSQALSAQTHDYDTKYWTELTVLDNTIQIDIRYATTNNFVQAKMYDCGRCFLRPEVAKAVEKAHKRLIVKGYGGFKMFDCYRPKPYQQRLWNKVPDDRYVTPPWKGSQHTRGLAVDITIVDKNGNELDMGTPFDTFSEKAHAAYQNLPANVLENRKLLRGVLEDVGFKGIRTEWWHFSFQNAKYGLSEWVWKCP